MSRLFIHLYLDEDVSVLIAKLIQSRGFQVSTTFEMHQAGQTDPDQLAFAARRQMAIVTHNRDDFQKLARAFIETGKPHSGIIISVRRSPYEIARRLLMVLNQFTADEIDNQTLII